MEPHAGHNEYNEAQHVDVLHEDTLACASASDPKSALSTPAENDESSPVQQLPWLEAALSREDSGPQDTDENNSASTSKGSICAAKDLYEGPARCKCCINWVEQYPDDLKESVEEQPETNKYALLVRHAKCHDGPRPMKLDSTVIQSPQLRPVLETIFKGYSGVTANLKYLKFYSPFKEFFYRWEQLERAADGNNDAVTSSHIQLLRMVLKAELDQTITAWQDLSRNNVVTFDSLWTLFVPGCQC